ncbi:MAG: class I SAM-dependent methyltransferase [Thermoleophilaceae bacterium]
MIAPERDAVARAGRESPLREGLPFTGAADRDELTFREEIEPYPDPLSDIPQFIDSKRLPEYLATVLATAGIVPAGLVVELGAGVCWLASALARIPEVERVVAVEFSRRRIADLAPIAIAHLGAPAAKVERIVADFHSPGLQAAGADLVVTDAAFHHSGDPSLLARVAGAALKPGGSFLLMREPTTTPLRGRRDHGLEAEHGDFEHEYSRARYLAFLEDAGLQAASYAAPGNLGSRRGRLVRRPPFSWLNGIAFSEYVYVGRKPREETA